MESFVRRKEFRIHNQKGRENQSSSSPTFNTHKKKTIVTSYKNCHINTTIYCSAFVQLNYIQKSHSKTIPYFLVHLLIYASSFSRNSRISLYFLHYALNSFENSNETICAHWRDGQKNDEQLNIKPTYSQILSLIDNFRCWKITLFQWILLNKFAAFNFLLCFFIWNLKCCERQNGSVYHIAV